jgi:glycosyltransferase involved in cell wall biosynthesis
MRVCLLGAFDPEYPRHRILATGLARHGIEVVEARVDETRAFRRWPALAVRHARVARRGDVVLVPEFRHKDVPLARVLVRGARLVFDPLVSRWDTLVHDWAVHAEGSPQARWNRMLDRWALRLADRVLCDTWAHGELFASLGARRADLRRVIVGAEDAFFDVPPPPETPQRCVLFLGGFLPLHGVPTIVEAASRLEARGDGLPPWRLVLAGRGIEFDRARAMAAERRLERVEFPGAVPYAEAPALFARADIVLGAFGANDKAGRVVPHKLYQGLAAGRAVVTGDGPGVREVLTPGEHVRVVPRADAAALADALAELLGDAGARAALAASGRARAEAIARPERVVEPLVHTLEELGA